MSDNKKTFNDGYIPQRNERGFQPAKPASQTSGDPKPKSGYVPATSGGTNPTNKPTPPSDE